MSIKKLDVKISARIGAFCSGLNVLTLLVPETENSALSVNTMQHLILIDSFLLAMEEREEELEEDADYIPSNASLVDYSKSQSKNER